MKERRFPTRADIFYIYPMKVAVTGANGHIGAALCRQLIELGFEVRVLIHRDDAAIRGLPVEQVRGSITDPVCLDQLCRGTSFVHHLAAHISIQGDPGGIVSRTNLEGTRQVVEACLRHRVGRLVHFSSVHAYKPPPFNQIMDESASLVDASGYAYEGSKSLGQQFVTAAVRDRGLDAVVLNPTSVLGPWDYKPSLQGKMLLDLYKGKIPALPPGGYDWVDNRDVAATACTAMMSGKPGDSYLLSGHYASILDFVRLAGTVTGRPMPKLVLPSWLLKSVVPLLETWGRVAGQPPLFTREALSHLETGHPGISSQKAALELGHQSRPLEVTLRDTFNWFVRNGNLKPTHHVF
jgi:dihydroflavonol-4-reductase